MFAPDIAISEDGTQAFVAATSTVNNVVFVWHLDLATHALYSTSLGYSAALPPRIKFSTDFNGTTGGAVVVAAAAGVKSDGDPTAPAWRIDTVSFNVSTHAFTKTKVSLGQFGNPGEATNPDDPTTGQRLIAGDFDFDCRPFSASPDDCVLVAPLHDTSTSTHPPGLIFSRHFTVTSASTISIDPIWTPSNQHDATAVIGVAISDAPTSARLIVSESKRSHDGANVNSRILEYSGFSVNPSIVYLSSRYISDANICDPASANGISMGASTPSGGNAIAWCYPGTCGTNGAVVSIHFGAEASSGSNFCF